MEDLLLGFKLTSVRGLGSAGRFRLFAVHGFLKVLMDPGAYVWVSKQMFYEKEILGF